MWLLQRSLRGRSDLWKQVVICAGSAGIAHAQGADSGVGAYPLNVGSSKDTHWEAKYVHLWHGQRLEIMHLRILHRSPQQPCSPGIHVVTGEQLCREPCTAPQKGSTWHSTQKVQFCIVIPSCNHIFNFSLMFKPKRVELPHSSPGNGESQWPARRVYKFLVPSGEKKEENNLIQCLGQPDCRD